MIISPVLRVLEVGPRSAPDIVLCAGSQSLHHHAASTSPLPPSLKTTGSYHFPPYHLCFLFFLGTHPRSLNNQQRKVKTKPKTSESYTLHLWSWSQTACIYHTAVFSLLQCASRPLYFINKKKKSSVRKLDPAMMRSSLKIDFNSLHLKRSKRISVRKGKWENSIPHLCIFGQRQRVERR